MLGVLILKLSFGLAVENAENLTDFYFQSQAPFNFPRQTWAPHPDSTGHGASARS